MAEALATAHALGDNRSRWQRWDHIAELFSGRPDPDWRRDIELVDQAITNPWEPER